MIRRNFLGGLAGILSASAAPAFITSAMKISVARDPRALEIKAAMDEFEALVRCTHIRTANEAVETQLAVLKRYQQIDVSRGLHFYEIPLVPVGIAKHTPILVAPERRVLRFS